MFTSLKVVGCSGGEDGGHGNCEPVHQQGGFILRAKSSGAGQKGVPHDPPEKGVQIHGQKKSHGPGDQFRIYVKGESPGTGVEPEPESWRTKPSYKQKKQKNPWKKESLAGKFLLVPICSRESRDPLWLSTGGRSVAATRVLTSDSSQWLSFGSVPHTLLSVFSNPHKAP